MRSHLLCILEEENQKALDDGLDKLSDPIKTKGRGAQGKMLECYTLAKQFKPYLDNWMRYREENNIHSEWLFPDSEQPGLTMTIVTLNSWAEVFSRMMGIDFYWHALRHMTVTNFKRAGIPDSVIQTSRLTNSSVCISLRMVW